MFDPIGMVFHAESLPFYNASPAPSASPSMGGGYGWGEYNAAFIGDGTVGGYTGWEGHRSGGGSRRGDDDGVSYTICHNMNCRHQQCVNCALFPGAVGGSYRAKQLVRTVGGLYTSPRFVDPVYWECSTCGELGRNRLHSRCVIGMAECQGDRCVGMRQAGRAQLGYGGETVGGGVLMADSVVMNRYGQRLGTADQRFAVADGPWHWQRRALGDSKCAVVSGTRKLMNRPLAEGIRRDGAVHELWKDGEPVPNYPYRRPPPLNEDDAHENNEYEVTYLAGMATEPLDKGKGREERYVVPSQSPRFGPASSPGGVSSGGASSDSSIFFSGWNNLQR